MYSFEKIKDFNNFEELRVNDLNNNFSSLIGNCDYIYNDLNDTYNIFKNRFNSITEELELLGQSNPTMYYDIKIYNVEENAYNIYSIDLVEEQNDGEIRIIESLDINLFIDTIGSVNESGIIGLKSNIFRFSLVEVIGSIEKGDLAIDNIVKVCEPFYVYNTIEYYCPSVFENGYFNELNESFYELLFNNTEEYNNLMLCNLFSVSGILYCSIYRYENNTYVPLIDKIKLGEHIV